METVAELEALQEQLGHRFRDAALLRLALTHASFGHEHRRYSADNQRLEFLGDAVLQLGITTYLYHRMPHALEGRLTVLRAQLVNRTQLAEVAQTLRLGHHLILGRGAESNKGRERESILADAMEALLGAVYLEEGFAETARIISCLWKEKLEAIVQGEQKLAGNPKGALQELLQTQGGETPSYRCEGETGPAHDRIYKAVVIWKQKELGRGEGKSKKEAEMNAAEVALQELLSKASSENS
jgi:ribonuclease-3